MVIIFLEMVHTKPKVFGSVCGDYYDFPTL